MRRFNIRYVNCVFISSYVAALVFALLEQPIGAHATPNAVPAGQQAQAAPAGCAQCHEGTALATMPQAPGTKALVYDLIARGAQLNAQETAVAIEHLQRNLGAASGPVATAPPALAAPEPAQGGLPDGPGKDVVERRCATCHALEPVLTSRTMEEWEEVIRQMIAMGLRMPATDIQTITAYLVEHFGIK